MDGGEVFVRLREDPDTRDIPICIVTGRPELRRLIYDKPHRPPEGYLDKPVGEETFIKNVRKILELSHKKKQ
jgi:CheY-like chemotaxis protein